jgi:glycine/D-amino acid oxidase-like deaminating enzyme
MDQITSLLSSDDPAEQELVASWMFPDQDLLAHVFEGKWRALPWCYNALKTMRYWHGNFWRDEEVRNVHYICDKPWKRRPARKSDAELVQADTDAPANPVDEPINPASRYTCTAGRFLGIHDAELGIPAEEADAITHGWWWDAYEQMHDRLVSEGYASLGYLEALVGK